jgi:hypothetical protein
MRSRPQPLFTRASLLRAKNALLGGIRAIADSSWIKFTTGVVLLTSGLDEAAETLFADVTALEFGAHHGVMLLGFVNVLSSLPDMLDGLVGTFLVDEHQDEPVLTVPAAASGDQTALPPKDAVVHSRRAA